MSVRENYYSLVTKNLSINDIDDVIALKTECKLENNYEFFYLSNILIIDIYIEEGLLGDAFNIATKNFDDLDKTIYKNIYISLLERLIYICIQRKNYQSACRYANEKRMYINIDDKETVNRWYLEMAYIHDALNEKTKSLSDLECILENEPDLELRLIVLNNITKLYIDNKNRELSKEYLNASINLANKLNDKSAKIYCNYLNAKLYILEGKNKFATKVFYDIFHGITDLDDEYLGYLNEFLALLSEMREYSEMKKMATKYLSSAEKTQDLYLKRDFYKYYLAANIFLVPSLSDEVKKLYTYIDKIENEIVKVNELITIESSEGDKISQINSKMKETTDKLEKMTNIINYALISKNERDCLFDFCKNLEKEVPFTNATFVVFNRATFEGYPKYLDSYSKVSTFDYKKERMYEREMNYSSLNNSIVELVVKNNKDVTIDFSETRVPINEAISGKSYLELKTKYLYATPLIYDGELYACAIYTSNNIDIISQDNVISLKIANRLLESKLINLYYQEGLRTQTNILQMAMDSSKQSIYYYEPKRKKIFFSDEFKNNFDFEGQFIYQDEYLKYIKEDDLDKFLKREEEMFKGNKYDIIYSLLLNNKSYLVREVGFPYFTKDGKIGFYVCTINDITPNLKEEDNKQVRYSILLNNDDLVNELKLLVNAKFSLLTIKLTKYDRALFDKLYQFCHELNENIYLIESNLYGIIIKDSNERAIEYYANRIYNELSDVVVTILNYPKICHDCDEIIPISLFAINNTSSITCIDENIVSRYNKDIYIANCVNNCINTNKMEFLYGPLYFLDELRGYYLSQNIRGLADCRNIHKNLDKETKIKFDIYRLENALLKERKVFLEISVETILWMIETDYINEENIASFRNIIFILFDNSPYFDKAFDYIKNNNIKLYLNINLINKIPISVLLENVTLGIFAIDNFDDVLYSKCLKLARTFDKKIITDIYDEDRTFIFFEGKMFKRDDLINDNIR